MFSERLRAARMNKKITQEKLSEAVGVALRSYQCYEQGVRRPSFEVLVKLADKLDISLDYLLGRDDFISKSK